MLKRALQPILHRRSLLTRSYLGQEVFQQKQRENLKRIENPNEEKQFLMNLMKKHGSRHLCASDAVKFIALAETREDIDVLADAIVDVCDQKYDRAIFIQNVYGPFSLLCLEYNDAFNALRVLQKVTSSYGQMQRKPMKRLIFILYENQMYREIVELLQDIKHDEIYEDEVLDFYIAASYRLGSAEAFQDLHKNRSLINNLRGCARTLYVVLAIERSHFDEAMSVISDSIPEKDTFSEMQILTLYCLIKQGKTSEALSFLDNWLKNSNSQRIDYYFSLTMMQELAAQVKDTRDKHLLSKFSDICKLLEIRAVMVDATVFDIAAGPRNANSANYNKNLS